MTSLEDKEKMGEIYFLRALNAIQDKPFGKEDIKEEDYVDEYIEDQFESQFYNLEE